MRDNSLHDFYFSEKEEIIMKALWGADKPLGVGEIIESISQYKWASTATHNIVKKLHEKQAIEVCDVVKISKTYGRLYKPTISAHEYAMLQFNKYCDKENIATSLISALLNNKNANVELEKSLEELLNKYKEE